jgi:hypothetical protein
MDDRNRDPILDEAGQISMVLIAQHAAPSTLQEMPVHPEMIDGEDAYEVSIQNAIEVIGRSVWESLPREVQEKIRDCVVQRERVRISDQFRKYFS